MTWSAPQTLPDEIATARMVVRPYVRGDGPALFAAVNAARDPLSRWLPWADDAHRHVDDSIHWVESNTRAIRKRDALDFAWVVQERTSKAVLGGVGFHRIESSQACAEVGYWIRGDRHGEGLCTEAVGPFVSLGFRSQEDGGFGFRRVVLHCAKDNVGSYRIAEKLGMRLERHERAERLHERPTPRYRDMLGYAVLASEWDFESDRAQPNIGWESFAP